MPSSSARLASGAAEKARTLSKPCSATSAGISGCAGDERRVRRLDDRELEPEPLRVLEAEARVVPRRVAIPSSARRDSQKSSASSEATRKVIVCTMPAPAPAAAGARVLEERDVGAGAALLVRVEEVVDGRVVLVDRLLDQPQSEHAV